MAVRLIVPITALIFTVWVLHEAWQELQVHGGDTAASVPRADPHRNYDPHNPGGPATMTTPEAGRASR